MRQLDGIAQCFSRAAPSYEQAAVLQRNIGEYLLQLLPANKQVCSWLDLGCGTGFFARQLQQIYPTAQGLALDLAPAMLQQAAQQSGFDCVRADAQRLPLQSNSLDLIFSNFALQWCNQIEQVLAQVQQALKPGGLMVFSSVLEGSLRELQQSWQQVDNHSHINTFRRLEDYRQACQLSSLQVLQLEPLQRVEFLVDTRQVLLSLKRTGATHLRSVRQAGLLSRQKFEQLEQAYERLRQPTGLPLSWQLLVVVLQKPPVEL